MNILEEIATNIDWLKDNNKSTNIVKISKVLNNLAILCVTLQEEVWESYKIMSDVEDEYDFAYTTIYNSLVDGGLSAAKAEVQAEEQAFPKKKELTSAKALYKKLDGHLERVDKVIDAFRQYVSNLKDERHYSVGGQV